MKMIKGGQRWCNTIDSENPINNGICDIHVTINRIRFGVVFRSFRKITASYCISCKHFRCIGRSNPFDSFNILVTCRHMY